MDTEKIKEIFQKWGKEKLLTEDGALTVRKNGIGGPMFKALSVIVLLVAPWSVFQFVSHFVDLGKDGGIIFVVFVYWVLQIGVMLWTFSAESLFYKDRLARYAPFKGGKIVFPYSELILVDYHLVVTEKSQYMALTLRFKHDEAEEAFVYRDERLVRLFSTCFKPIFRNRFFYDDMFCLFANVICLKQDDAYRAKGLEAALKYLSPLSESKYCVSDCEEHLLRCMEEDRQEYIDTCLAILKNKGVDYADRLELLSHLFECAYASDGMVDEEELDRLSRIAYYFRVREWDFLSLKYSFEALKQQRSRRNGKENAQQSERYQSAYSNRLREAYKILELKEKASLEEVKSAYRKLVKTCHPDTLSPNAKDSEREEAAIRFRTITEAYDFLCAELCAEPVSVAR